MCLKHIGNVPMNRRMVKPVLGLFYLVRVYALLSHLP